MRSLLSTLGILFGVGAVIGILSIGEGARHQQDLLVAELGILNFQLRAVELPEDEEARHEILRKSAGLSQRDVRALRNVLTDATEVGGLRQLEVGDIVPRPRDPDAVRVVGADLSYLQGTKLVLLKGRPFLPRDMERNASVCLLGIGAKHQIFGSDRGLGKRLRLGEVWVTVVGIFDTPGGRAATGELAGVDIDDRTHDIILPLSSSLLRFETDREEPELSEIQVSVAAADQVEGHAQLAQRLISRLHRDQDDVELVVPIRLLEQTRAQQQIFNLVMGLIAGISLLVGGIGIMNIMLASVLERTREIGVRRALGATAWDIRLLFLTEAGLISMTGGLLGILAGYGISALVASVTGWHTAVSPAGVIVASLVSLTEGIIFGLIPAQRAAQLPPAQALRAS